jgi:hypothetical protein
VRRIAVNARVGGDGCATLQGGTKGRRPITLEPGPDRISPPMRSSTVYHGPGFAKNAPPEARAGPYGKSSRLSWEFIGGSSPHATLDGARRSPCKAEACTLRPPGSSCGPSSSLQAGGCADAAGLGRVPDRARRRRGPRPRGVGSVPCGPLSTSALAFWRACERRLFVPRTVQPRLAPVWRGLPIKQIRARSAVRLSDSRMHR